MKILKFSFLFCSLIPFYTHANVLNVCVPTPLKNNAKLLHLKVWEPLVKPVGENATIIPLLAKNWNVDEKGLKWKFELRDKISFQATGPFRPTRSLNAEDVQFSLEQSPLMGKVIKKIKILSPLSLELELTQKDEKFLKRLASDQAAIKSKELEDLIQSTESPRHRSQLKNVTTGTGPFRLISHDSNTYSFNTYENYHMGEVQYKQLNIKYIIGDNKRTGMLETGLCQIVYQADLKALQALPAGSYTTIDDQQKKYLYVAFNPRKSPLNEEEMQKAFLQSLDSNQLNQEYFYGKANFTKIQTTPEQVKMVMTGLKLHQMPKLKMAKVTDSPTLNPNYAKLVAHIHQTFSNASGSKIDLDHMELAPKLRDTQLANWHIIITPHKNGELLNYHQLLEINEKIALSNKIKNFWYRPGQMMDFSVIEFQ